MSRYTSNPPVANLSPVRDGPVSLGVEFKVTQPNQKLREFLAYTVPSTYGGVITAALYQVGVSTPLFTPISVDYPKTGTAQWLSIPAPNFDLVPETRYRAVLHYSVVRPRNNGALSVTYANGPLTVFSHATATNGNHTYTYGALTNAALSAGSNYMLDVAVGEVVPPVVLSPNSAVHEHRASSAAHAFRPASSAHEAVVSSPGLVQIHKISPDPSDHATGSTEPALTTFVWPDSTQHEQTATSPTLPMPVDNSVHEQDASEPALVQTHTLRPDHSVHEQTSEADLTQVHLLAPDSTVHELRSSSPGHAEVWPDDAVHGHAATSPTVSQTSIPQTHEYWVRARYAHQNQQKPDQPDNSWDPYDLIPGGDGDYPWWTRPEWLPLVPVYPGIDLGPAGPSCYVAGYSQPGDRYTMPFPAFYPGENSTLSASGAANGGLYMPDDGVTHVAVTGEVFVAGASTWNYNRMEPRPSLANVKGHFYFRVRGHGSISFEPGLDVQGNWNWYYGDPTSPDLTWWGGAQSGEIDTDEWIDIGIHIPPDYLTASYMGEPWITYILKAEVTAGSVEFDYGELRIAGDCGYHRPAFEVVDGPWGKTKQVITEYSDWFPRASFYAQQTLGTEIVAKYAVPDVVQDRGYEVEPPAAEARGVVQSARDTVQATGVPQATGSEAPADGSGYFADLKPRYLSGGPGNEASFFGESDIPKWTFNRYHAPISGTGEQMAWFSWGRDNAPDLNSPEHERRAYLSGTYFRFSAPDIPLPWNPGDWEAWSEPRKLLHLPTNPAVEYDEAQTVEFLEWVAVPPLEGPVDPLNDKHYWTMPTAISHDTATEEWQISGSAHAELVTNWQPGQPLPGRGSGTTISSAAWGPGTTSPGYQRFDPPTSITSTDVAVFVYGDSGAADVMFKTSYYLKVLLPRYRTKLVVWEYIGG